MAGKGSFILCIEGAGSPIFHPIESDHIAITTQEAPARILRRPPYTPEIPLPTGPFGPSRPSIGGLIGAWADGGGPTPFGGGSGPLGPGGPWLPGGGGHPGGGGPPGGGFGPSGRGGLPGPGGVGPSAAGPSIPSDSDSDSLPSDGSFFGQLGGGPFGGVGSPLGPYSDGEGTDEPGRLGGTASHPGIAPSKDYVPGIPIPIDGAHPNPVTNLGNMILDAVNGLTGGHSDTNPVPTVVVIVKGGAPGELDSIPPTWQKPQAGELPDLQGHRPQNPEKPSEKGDYPLPPKDPSAYNPEGDPTNPIVGPASYNPEGDSRGGPPRPAGYDPDAGNPSGPVRPWGPSATPTPDGDGPSGPASFVNDYIEIS